MNQFLDMVMDFFFQVWADILTFVNILLNGATVLSGLVRSVVFIIILALIMGFVLNNRRIALPKLVYVAFVVVVLVLVFVTLFG